MACACCCSIMAAEVISDGDGERTRDAGHSAATRWRAIDPCVQDRAEALVSW